MTNPGKTQYCLRCESDARGRGSVEPHTCGAAPEHPCAHHYAVTADNGWWCEVCQAHRPPQAEAAPPARSAPLPSLLDLERWSAEVWAKNRRLTMEVMAAQDAQAAALTAQCEGLRAERDALRAERDALAARAEEDKEERVSIGNALAVVEIQARARLDALRRIMDFPPHARFREAEAEIARCEALLGSGLEDNNEQA